MPVSIEEYFLGTPRRFDIVYIDACGPLPSAQQTTRILSTLFRQSALAPLGVLITNFSKPSLTEPDNLERYAYLIAAYLFPKGFLDSREGGFDNGAEAYGYTLRNDENVDESLFHHVMRDFDHQYSTYITRQILDIASTIAPSIRLANNPRLREVLFNKGVNAAALRGKRFVRFSPTAFTDDDVELPAGILVGSHVKDVSSPLSDQDVPTGQINDMDGDALLEPSDYSLLWTLAACGFYDTDGSVHAPPAHAKEFLNKWVKELYGLPEAATKVEDVVAAYYAWRDDQALWSNAMRPIAEYSYRQQMPFLCDVPTEEIGFYPALAQIAYPAHCNINETRRYSYVAEGKLTTMFLDVLPFDECRYVYDWLSAVHLVPDDWNDLSAQLTFRFALDGIAKNIRWYGEDFLSGCHVVGWSKEFPMSELSARKAVAAKKRRWRK